MCINNFTSNLILCKISYDLNKVLRKLSYVGIISMQWSGNLIDRTGPSLYFSVIDPKHIHMFGIKLHGRNTE